MSFDKYTQTATRLKRMVVGDNMKKILMILMLTTIGFSQWVTVAPKPPVEMRQLFIPMNYWHEQARDSNQVVIPDSFNIAYDVNYRIFMYDEDGKIVGNNQTQGDLQPYLTTAEKLWLKNFLDKYGAIATGLLPE